MIKEACIETFDEAFRAYRHGADMLEVCSRLDLDGLTPDMDLVHQIMSKIPVPVKIMIRPRPGDFEYSSEDLQAMGDTMLRFKELNPAGFVLGCTEQDGLGGVQMNMVSVTYLCEKADPVPVTIHKAIDECSDILKEVNDLKKINNIHFILTSGGKATAREGLDELREMAKASHPEIKIIAAGKITSYNLSDLHKELNLEYYHGRKIVC